MNLIHELKFLFFKRAITVQPDPEVHRHTFRASLIAALIYSVAYGFYEYFIVYHYPELLGLYGGEPLINWGMMYSALILTVAIAPRFGWYKTLAITLSYSCAYILAGIYMQVLLLPLILVCIVITLLFVVSIEQTVMGLFLMTVFEDFMFFVSSWIDTGVYPYPACTIGDPGSCWWNNDLMTFHILGDLGNPLPVWPYIPIYYIPGGFLVFFYYFASFKGAIYGRIYGWIVGSLFLAIVGGALVADEYIATMILVFVPVILIGYAYTLSNWNYHARKGDS